jgi:predicted Zn-dependent protease
VQKPVSEEQRLKQDNSQGQQLAPIFESKLQFKKDIEVQVFLREMASKLVDATPELKLAPVGAMIIVDRDHKWRNYALPGNRLYLSVGMLKSVEFDNEIAGAMAIELGHILGRHALKRYDAQLTSAQASGLPTDSQPRFFGGGGIFSFSEQDDLDAIDFAVGILYRAGYDPRGLVGYLQKNQEKRGVSPFEPGALPKLIERAHETIAQYTPLRNPIVRTESFLKLQKRIRKL